MFSFHLFQFLVFVVRNRLFGFNFCDICSSPENLWAGITIRLILDFWVEIEPAAPPSPIPPMSLPLSAEPCRALPSRRVPLSIFRQARGTCTVRRQSVDGIYLSVSAGTCFIARRSSGAMRGHAGPCACDRAACRPEGPFVAGS